MSVLTRELLANNPQTTLSANITSTGATSCTVTTGGVFPSTGNFRVIVGNEIMLVTARSSNTLTIVRGQEGTSAATHSSGDAIALILTQGSLERFLRDSYHLVNTSAPPTGRILDASGNTLTSSSFTITNGVSATVTDQTDGSIFVRTPAQAGGSGDNIVSLMRTAPSTPYSVTTAVQFMFCAHNFGAFRCGVCVGDGTKFVTNNVFMSSSAASIKFSNSKFNSATSLSGDYDFGDFAQCNGLYLWLQIADDGTNLDFYRSYDGINWLHDFQVSRTDWMGSGPSVVGIFTDNATQTSGTYPAIDAICTFAHYSEG